MILDPLEPQFEMRGRNNPAIMFSRLHVRKFTVFDIVIIVIFPDLPP